MIFGIILVMTSLVVALVIILLVLPLTLLAPTDLLLAWVEVLIMACLVVFLLVLDKYGAVLLTDGITWRLLYFPEQAQVMPIGMASSTLQPWQLLLVR